MAGYDPQDRIDVEPLAQAFLASGRSAASVAKELGMVTGDSTRLKRVLGLAPRGKRWDRANIPSRTIDYDRAAELCRILDVDPVEVGL